VSQSGRLESTIHHRGRKSHFRDPNINARKRSIWISLPKSSKLTQSRYTWCSETHFIANQLRELWLHCMNPQQS